MKGKSGRGRNIFRKMESTGNRKRRRGGGREYQRTAQKRKK